MQVIDLDGHITNWSVTSGTTKGSINKSSLHILARDLIKQVYPTMHLLEEVTIYIRKNEVAYLDFYLPLIRTSVEVHGEQHYKFTPFYHANPMAFLKAQRKDKEKREWCEKNNIKILELPFNKKDTWKEIITNG